MKKKPQKDYSKPTHVMTDNGLEELPQKNSPQEREEEQIHMICIDAWANINESLQKHGAKYKGDGIGTTYSGWIALCEIVYPRVHQLLKAERERAIKEIEKIITDWLNQITMGVLIGANLKGTWTKEDIGRFNELLNNLLGKINKKINQLRDRKEI